MHPQTESDKLRIVGWVAPGVCIAIAAYMTFTKHQELQSAQKDLREAQVAVQEATEASNRLEKMGDQVRFAATTMGPYEESSFLNDLRSRAQAAGVDIKRWDSRSRSLGETDEDKQGDPAEKERAAKLKNITRISSDLTLVGSYAGLRKFLGGITASPRLFTLSNVKWSRNTQRDGEGTELLVSIARYVEPANAETSNVAPTEPGQPGTGVN